MKKIISLMLAAMMAASLFTGCSSSTSGSSEPGNTDPQNSAPAESTATGDKVEINYFTWRSQPDRHPEKLIAAFEAKNPNIKVNYQVIKNLDEYLQAQQVRLLSGTDIDVTSIRPESINNYIEAGYLLDITGMNGLNNYMDGTLDKITKDSKVYGIPGAINLIAVYYNKDLFQEHGVKVPTTYQEFIDACEAFKAKGMKSMANGCKDGWPVQFDIYTYMHDLMVKDPEIFEKANRGEIKYTDPVFVDTFKKIDAFYKAGYLHEDSMSFTGDDAVSLFVGKKIPMLCQGEWQATTFDTAELEFEMGLFPIPVESSSEIVIPVSVGHFDSGVASTKHPEEVKKFLEFMSTQEGASIVANQMTSFSPVNGVKLEGESKINLFNDLLSKKSVDFFYSSQKADDNSEFVKLMQEMFLKVITPEQAAQNLQEYHDSNA